METCTVDLAPCRIYSQLLCQKLEKLILLVRKDQASAVVTDALETSFFKVAKESFKQPETIITENTKASPQTTSFGQG